MHLSSFRHSTYRKPKRGHSLAVALLALLVAVSTGCLTTGTKMEQSKIDQIKKGVTTRAEIEALFGPPMAVGMAGEGKRMMFYQYNEAKVGGSSFIPFAGPFVGKSERRNQNLQILLNAQGIVEDFEFGDVTAKTTGGAMTPSTTFEPTAKP